MKLISWNVNGLRAVRKKGFADFVRRSKPDALCLQEPKIGFDQLEDVDISHAGYQNFYSLALKRGYSGVLTYVDDSLKVQTKKCSSGIGVKRFDQEGRVVVTALEDIILYNIYFPSGTSGDIRQDYKFDFLKAIYKHFKQLSPKDKERLVVCGDFNICHQEIDIHHPKTAAQLELSGFLPEERRWMDEFSELGFVDCFRQVNGDKPDKYTWWSYRAGAREKNLGWRIDYFWVSKKLERRVSKASILNRTLGSDHCPIVLELD